MILTVTGHRPAKLGGYGQANWEMLINFAKRALVQLNPTRVITGMALGWDQAVAQACVELGVPFEAHIPCLGQDKRWPYESQRRYAAILSSADQVVSYADEYTPACLQLRNIGMVDAADKVLALWDGSPGGTANCVGYARKTGKPLTQAWKAYGAFKAAAAVVVPPISPEAVATPSSAPRVAVVNRHSAHPAAPWVTRVYIGRPSVLGNPYPVGQGEGQFDRETSVGLYDVWLTSRLNELGSAESVELVRLVELARTGPLELECFCAPRLCHGDILARHILDALREGGA